MALARTYIAADRARATTDSAYDAINSLEEDLQALERESQPRIEAEEDFTSTGGGNEDPLQGKGNKCTEKAFSGSAECGATLSGCYETDLKAWYSDPKEQFWRDCAYPVEFRTKFQERHGRDISQHRAICKPAAWPGYSHHRNCVDYDCLGYTCVEGDDFPGGFQCAVMNPSTRLKCDDEEYDECEYCWVSGTPEDNCAVKAPDGYVLDAEKGRCVPPLV